MRKLVSILFLSLLLLQAIPVLHFFAAKKAVFYSLIDEEKPTQKAGLEKKEGKEFLSVHDLLLPEKTITACFAFFTLSPYTSPPLEALTPPPNA